MIKKRGYFSVSCLCCVHLKMILAFVCESSPLVDLEGWRIRRELVRRRSHRSVVLVYDTCTVTVCVFMCVSPHVCAVRPC